MNLTHSEVLQEVSYCPDTGVFTKLKDGGGVKAGEPTGSIMSHGYVEIFIRGQRTTGHRLAWFVMTGEWPDGVVDHRNLNRSDNSWLNLRGCTHKQNCANRGKNPNNRSGFKGVTASPTAGKWIAQIMVDRRNIYLGTHESAEAAAEAYKQAARLHHGEFMYE